MSTVIRHKYGTVLRTVVADSLRGAHLGGLDLGGANLGGANLRGANLRVTNLRGANLQGANLRVASLRDANLGDADLRGAHLGGADLRTANLRGADLRGTSLRGADLRHANLCDADLSGATGLPDTLAWFRKNFKATGHGVIVYKAFGLYQQPPDTWKIEPGAVLSENCSPNPQDDCGCGINFATRAWIEQEIQIERKKPAIWRCLIRWAWLPGVVIPWGTDGKARCSKLQLISIVREGK